MSKENIEQLIFVGKGPSLTVRNLIDTIRRAQESKLKTSVVAINHTHEFVVPHIPMMSMGLCCAWCDFETWCGMGSEVAYCRNIFPTVIHLDEKPWKHFYEIAKFDLRLSKVIKQDLHYARDLPTNLPCSSTAEFVLRTFAVENGVKKIMTVGIDGGSQKSKAFEDNYRLKPQESYDVHYRRFHEERENLGIELMSPEKA